ncbi:hypothetical protein [Gimesia panareensis]|uniref:hypothetical protein n=1 Tax=Gimesia panareensis TaxID=2527978 RepID=UPI0011A85ED0|nr:hypothetical protein [Gimesia panareensis]
MILSPYAGEEYPTKYPALPYGNTVEGYRKAFGHLDYLYRFESDESFDGDTRHAPELDSEVLEACRFVVYPFVSQEIYWSVHKDAVAQIRQGVEHPRAKAILAAYDAESQMNECWQALSRADIDFVLAVTRSDNSCLESIPEHIQRFLELEENARQRFIALSHPERNRVRSCVAQVRGWIEQCQNSS